MRKHTGEKPYQCSKCDKAYLQKIHLINHMRVHTGEKPPLQCNQCDKAFAQKFRLINHMIGHTGGKPYQCSQCDKGFTQKGVFIKHMRKHTGRNHIHEASVITPLLARDLSLDLDNNIGKRVRQTAQK